MGKKSRTTLVDSPTVLIGEYGPEIMYERNEAFIAWVNKGTDTFSTVVFCVKTTTTTVEKDGCVGYAMIDHMSDGSEKITYFGWEAIPSLQPIEIESEPFVWTQ